MGLMSARSTAPSSRASCAPAPWPSFVGQEALDRINVFPVRDADTGANLTATFKAAAARLGSGAPDGVAAAAQAAADGALDGARGNSGAIVAQFLHGLAEGMDGRHQVDGPQFAAATRAGDGVRLCGARDPREGTILSVLRHGRTSSCGAPKRRTSRA